MKKLTHRFDWQDPASQKIFQTEVKDFSIAERYPRDAERLTRCLALRTGEKILDFGCGTGQHAVCLRQQGRDIFGYDPSADFIHQARATMRQAGVTLPFYDSAEFMSDHAAGFDVVYTIFFPFVTLGESGIRAFFETISGLLADHGRFFFGFPYTRENREQHLPRNRWEESDGVFRLVDETLDEKGYRVERYLIIDTVADTLSEWLDENQYYYLAQIEEWVTAGGCAVTGYFADFEAASASDAARVNGLLCRKR